MLFELYYLEVNNRKRWRQQHGCQAKQPREREMKMSKPIDCNLLNEKSIVPIGAHSEKWRQRVSRTGNAKRNGKCRFSSVIFSYTVIYFSLILFVARLIHLLSCFEVPCERFVVQLICSAFSRPLSLSRKMWSGFIYHNDLLKRIQMPMPRSHNGTHVDLPFCFWVLLVLFL